jgi:hypothetical protein
MFRNLLIVCLGLLMVATLGCDAGGPKPLPTAAVKGTVNLNGQPMAAGEVVFTGELGPKVLAVTNGTYAGEAAVGKNRVEVHSYKEVPSTSGLSTDTVSKEELVAPQFNSSSTLTADVTAAGPNEFKFDVTGK